MILSKKLKMVKYCRDGDKTLSKEEIGKELGRLNDCTTAFKHMDLNKWDIILNLTEKKMFFQRQCCWSLGNGTENKTKWETSNCSSQSGE